MQNFTKESIEQAIAKIEADPTLLKGRESKDYDLLIENGKSYPPILVLSEANKVLGGDQITIEDFGNTAQNALNILTQLGFRIEKRLDYSNELYRFLDQSKTSQLATKPYQKEFAGLEVTVSFGQGIPARIPWIAFLLDGQSVQNGIYPVYLYYKDRDTLILAYGVSETHKSIKNWSLKKTETIKDFFSTRGWGTPQRYGSSYVFEVYNTSQKLDKRKINGDLLEIIKQYKMQIESEPLIDEPKPTSLFEHSFFHQAALSSNLFLDGKITTRFVASLLTKPFVILTGLSGSGKTKLAHAFASWICEDEKQLCIVPVGADWTNREPLLGFPNALIKEDYVRPESGVLDLMISANTNQHKPYFLILDEMNLSHVERYFADFLSVMESYGSFSLHSGKTDWNGVPSKIFPTKNLFIIGTVNIDETTYMFSPKVLDRANVIEFRVTSEEMNAYLSSYKKLDFKSMIAGGSGMANGFINLSKDETLEAGNVLELNSTLMSFFRELKTTGAEFGYRSASEIIRFAAVINKIAPDWSIEDIMDAAIMQKLLPKVHGSRRKLESVLKTLGSLCLQENEKISDYISAKTDIDYTDRQKIKYPISLEKILRMNVSLLTNGFTSFAEA